MATVTASGSGTSLGNGVFLQVLVLDNAALAGTPATAVINSGNNSAYSASITTTQAGSLVVGLYNDWNSNTDTLAPVTGCTAIAATPDNTLGTEYGAFRTTSATGTPGATTVGYANPGTNDGYAGCAIEVLSSGGTVSLDGSAPAAVVTSSALTVTTASFTPPTGTILVALVSLANNDGTNNNSGFAATVSDTGLGLTWTPAKVSFNGSITGSTAYVGIFTAAYSGAATAAVQSPVALLVPPGTQSPAAFSALPPDVVALPPVAASRLIDWEADYASGTDAGERVTASVSSTDSGAGSDSSGQVTASVSSTDSGAGSESYYAGVSQPDSGSGLDSSGLVSASVPAWDGGSFYYSNNFECGTNGTAITIANSGGPGETPFANAAVTGAGTGTLTYDNSKVFDGSLSMRFNTTVSPALERVFWTPPVPVNGHLYCQFYVNLDSLPPVLTSFATLVGASGSSWAARVTTAGVVSVFVTGATVGTGTAVLSAGTWYRVESDFAISSGSGSQVTVRLYDSGGTLLDTVASTANGTATYPAISSQSFYLGNASGTGLVFAGNLDDVAITDFSWIGGGAGYGLAESSSIGISRADSGAGSDSSGQVSASVSSTDSGSGLDSSGKVTASLSGTDYGSGSESYYAGVSQPDSGSGLDSGILIQVSSTNAGSGAGSSGAVLAVALDYDSGTGLDAAATVSVSSSDSASVQDFEAVNSPSLTVTASQGGATFQGIGLRVKVLRNVALAQNGAVASVTANCSASITTTMAGAVVYGAISSGSSGLGDPEAGTSFIDDYLDGLNGESYGSFKYPVTVPGTILVGGTGGDGFSDIAAMEVIPDGVLAEDPSGPPFVEDSTHIQVTTAVFAPPVGSYLLALVASDGAANGSGTTTIAVSEDTGNLVWTEVIRASSTTSCYAGVWMARVTSTTPSLGDSGSGSEGGLVIGVSSSDARHGCRDACWRGRKPG